MRIPVTFIRQTKNKRSQFIKPCRPGNTRWKEIVIARTNKDSDTGKQKKSSKVYTNQETGRKDIFTVGDSIIKDIVGALISKNMQARCYNNSWWGKRYN